MPDLGKLYWSVAEAAEYLGIKPGSVYRYRVDPKRGFPPEDATFGRSPVWFPATIVAYKDRAVVPAAQPTDGAPETVRPADPERCGTCGWALDSDGHRRRCGKA
jgi:hypothetical protein